MLTEKEILLVRNSWSFVIIHSAKAGELFYGQLFELAPEVKPLFKGDINDQAKKLTSMVTLLISKLKKLDDIMNEVKALARRHVNYGTQPKHYDVVGQALLWTLEKGLKDKWNPEVADAWKKLYSILSKAMIEGQQEKVVKYY